MKITKVALTFVLALSICFTHHSAQAVLGEVLLSGADESITLEISQVLSKVINSFETSDLSTCNNYFTPEGYTIAADILTKVQMQNGRRTHRTNLLKLPAGGWEVRDIKVLVDLGETDQNPVLSATNPNQYLVFQLTEDGLISDMRFAIENTHYKKLVEDGLRLNDFARRQQILQTVEIFRTAYCRKDTEYLKRIYSDDALIIVGRVLEPRQDLPDMLESSALDRKKIEFIRKSKSEYLSSLDSVFTRNAFVKVVFDSIDVIRHEVDHDLYGVSLKQNWYSSTYSDTGWVFLLWDFKDEKNPTIYVRSWQPERFEDGSIIDLYEFEIVRSK